MTTDLEVGCHRDSTPQHEITLTICLAPSMALSVSLSRSVSPFSLFYISMFVRNCLISTLVPFERVQRVSIPRENQFSRGHRVHECESLCVVACACMWETQSLINGTIHLIGHPWSLEHPHTPYLLLYPPIFSYPFVALPFFPFVLSLFQFSFCSLSLFLAMHIIILESSSTSFQAHEQRRI